MAYEPQTWETGHRITAEKMNHIEQGIAGAGGGSTEPLIVNVTENDDSYYMDKTFGEIRRAFLSGQTILVIDSYNTESGDEDVRYAYVKAVEYTVHPRGENASGTISANQSYNVNVSEAPYTLEALDAKIPYYN